VYACVYFLDVSFGQHSQTTDKPFMGWYNEYLPLRDMSVNMLSKAETDSFRLLAGNGTVLF
jgi:hypothetical protein